MNARDELAPEIFIADNSAQAREESTKDWAAYNMATDQTYAHNIADGLLAAGYTKPRTITTAEELDALPVGSVVIDGHGDVCERASSGWTGIIKEPTLDTWLLTGAEDLPLDCTVLFEPTA